MAENGDKLKTKSIKKDIREIVKPAEDKTVKITKITQSRTLSIFYIVTIQVCAGKEKLYNPEIEIKSDRDSITVKVWGLVMSNACKSNDYLIRANDKSTISVGFSKSIYRDYQRTA